MIVRNPVRALTRASSALLLVVGSIAAPAPPAAADDVHLHNGRVFEDVVAVVDGDEVRIHLPFGEITLPAARVAAIDRSESSLERYRARKEALRRDPRAGAAEWLELAREARRQGFDHGYRDAARVAARLDPALPGLAPVMRDLGYLWDAELGEWLPRDQALRRRGLVRVGDEWVSAAEREAQLRAEAEASRERAERRRLDRLATTLEAVVELELARSLSGPEVQVVVPPSASYPVYSVPYYRRVPAGRRPHRGPRPGGAPHRGPPAPEPAPAPEPGPTGPPAGRTHHGGYSSASSFGGSLGPPELTPGRLNPDAAPAPGRIGSR